MLYFDTFQEVEKTKEQAEQATAKLQIELQQLQKQKEQAETEKNALQNVLGNVQKKHHCSLFCVFLIPGL